MRVQAGSTQKLHSSDRIGILSFEVAGAMSKTVQLYRSLSASEISNLCTNVFRSHAVGHLISDDETHLLRLAAAEKLEELRRIAAVVSRLGKRCAEPAMVGFEHVFSDLLCGRVLPSQLGAFSLKDMDSAVKKMERFVSSTALLYSELELHVRRKRRLRETSLWNQSPERIFSLMARAISTVFARIRLVFNSPARVAAGDKAAAIACGSTPVRLLGECLIFSGTSQEDEGLEEELEAEEIWKRGGGGGSTTAPAAMAAPSTVGGSALALHYANIIIIIEKFLRLPHLVGEEARDDLYQMLPTSLKTTLRNKLRSYAKDLAIYDAPVAFDWKSKLEKTLTWLSPMAHNMVTWQTERNFEQSRVVAKVNVLLLQTIYFADREKTEAVICELLVGLNYICRYEQQHNALLRSGGSFDFDHFVDWRL